MPQEMITALRRGMVLAAAGGLMLIPISGTALAADKPGMKKASASVAKAVIADTVPGANVKCMTVRVTKSSKSWGAVDVKTPPPAGCPSPGDGIAVVKKEAGSWGLVPLANNASCEDIRAVLKAEGASKAVLRDFLKGYFTC